MTTYNPYQQQYQTLSVNTMTPGETIVRLYEEMISRLNRAILYIRGNKASDAHSNIVKAEDILLYLMEILDMDVPVSDQLMQIYEYLYDQLVKANTAKDEKIILTVLGFLNDLKTSWQQAETETRTKGKSL